MTINRNYTARAISLMTAEQARELPDGGLIVEFDDGEVHKCYTQRIIQSRYYWQLFSENSVNGITHDHYIGDSEYNKSTHNKISGRIFWDVFMGLNLILIPGQNLKVFWELSRRLYQIGNEIYNDSCTHDAEYLSTLDITDIIEILEAPVVIKTKARYKEGEIDVETAHDIIYEFMSTPQPGFELNEIYRGCRAGLYNRRQLTQLIGPRAIIPEINGDSFKTPIETGYAEGLNSFYDRAIESRTASIAYYSQKAPLEDSEYNNRQCQFLVAVVGEVFQGDCGGAHTVEWSVREGDEKYLTGKYIMSKGKPVMLHPGAFDKIKEGDKLAIRSVTKCSHGDPSHPCAICVGIGAWTTPPTTVYGHHVTIEILAIISQAILSVKHVISSVKSVLLQVNETNTRYLHLDESNPHLVMLKENVSRKGHTQCLRVPAEDLMFINDVNNTENINKLQPYRISSCTDIQFTEYSEVGALLKSTDLNVGVGGKGSPLTMAMLEHMKLHGWELIGKNIEINLDGWDYEQPVFITPRRGEDMMEVLTIIQNFLHAPDKKPGAIRAIDFETPDAAIPALLDLLNTKVSMNFAQAEVFVRALMSKVDLNGNPTYELPIGDDPFIFCKMKNCIMKRNLGCSLAFERIFENLFNPSSYLNEDKQIPGSVQDILWPTS